MLQNADHDTLTVHQIAAHLGTRPDNITRELNLAKLGQRGRLHGEKVSGPGIRGRAGQWRVQRTTYLDWLGLPSEDRDVLNAFGLPWLIPLELAAGDATGDLARAKALIPKIPHVTFGRRIYLTHHQLQRLSVLLAKDCWDRTQ